MAINTALGNVRSEWAIYPVTPGADEIVELKTTPGQLMFMQFTNKNTHDVFVHFFDVASADDVVAEGSVWTQPHAVFQVGAGNGTLYNSVEIDLNRPLYFENGISFIVSGYPDVQDFPNSSSSIGVQLLYR